MPEPKVRKPRAPKAAPVAPTLRPALPRHENGELDWRKIVSNDNIMLNKNYWADEGIDVTTLEDHELEKIWANSPDEGLLMLLSGFRQLARARGVRSTRFNVEWRSEDCSVVKCEMVLVPNEEEPYEVVISGIANSSPQNTGARFSVYPDAMASNRAECRAWRQYFNLRAVSYEEINPLEKEKTVADKSTPSDLLTKMMEQEGYAPDDISLLFEETGIEPNPKWGGLITKLSEPICLSLVDYMKKKAAARKK